MLDARGRPLTDLRISLTDRCNFRCGYCMPREIFGPEHVFLPADQLLSFDEIVEIVDTAMSVGVTKVRLTGGEPLMRPGIVELVGRITALGALDLAMTTNGVLLPRHAAGLAAAGLTRLTVSLDALDDETFQTVSDSRFRVSHVLAGINAAVGAGFSSVKVNAVVRRGLNDHQVPHLLDRFRGTGHVVRFIEYMDVGATNGWRLDEVVGADHIVAMIQARWPVEELPPTRSGEVARRYRLRDGSAEFGVISSVTAPFCGDCTRARVTADGRLHTCLFSSEGTDLASMLRGERRPGDLRQRLAGLWSVRDDRYSELRGSAAAERGRPVEMSYIGG